MSEILVGIFLGIISSELLGLSTWLAYLVVKKAVNKYVPEPYRRDTENEWLSHIEGMSSHVKFFQLWTALGIFFKAAPKIRKQYEEISVSHQTKDDLKVRIEILEALLLEEKSSLEAKGISSEAMSELTQSLEDLQRFHYVVRDLQRLESIKAELLLVVDE